MNRFLADILEQPAVLQQVLAHGAGPGRAEVRAAAARIRSAARVVVTSMGSALISGMPVAWALSRIHHNVRLAETAELLRETIDPAPLYLVLSRSGESVEVAEFARRLRERGGALVAITMTPGSTLARHADIVVHDIASFDGFICTKAFSSLILVGLLIAAELGGELGDALMSALSASFADMERQAPQLRSAISALAPSGAGGVTFLAEGAGMCLAHAGALWTEEAARVRCSASSFAQFRHGPIEQVDAAFHGCWIDLAPSERTRAMHAELTRHGGRVAVVTAAGAYPGAFAFALGDLPEAFRVLAPAIAVQLIAWRTASGLGLEPGQMRYLGWVVT
jgi:glucosamine 6-phosphate synthetase-like amidotransferase/phosphosugar isomerase protein